MFEVQLLVGTSHEAAVPLSQNMHVAVAQPLFQSNDVAD